MIDPGGGRRDPADWRDRLIAILSGDGVTELPKIAKWKRYLGGFGRVFGWALLVPLFAFIGVAILGYPIFLIVPHDSVASYLNMLTMVLIVPAAWFAMPRMRRAYREIAQIKLGHQPIQVLRDAKHPPVLFLRSFNFDSISSAVPKWQEYLPINVPMPTAELNLVQMIWRHAPVLAIGRPGESTPPSGAVRFYVRQDIWKKTVEAIVPLCPLIVWTTGHTEGLRWEIKHLLEHLPPQKLLLWLHFNVGRRTPVERDSEWAKFLESYRDIFPKPLPEEAAKGRFIAFEDDWTPVVVPGPGYRPSFWELIASWPSTYGLEPFLRQRLDQPQGLETHSSDR
jgi:hypothetical protein